MRQLGFAGARAKAEKASATHRGKQNSYDDRREEIGMRIVFFTALKEERLALRQAWPLKEAGTLQKFPFDTGDRAVSLCSGVGAERMAQAVEFAMRALRPDLAILLGFSAGLRSDIAVGDVICDEDGDESLVSSLRSFPLPLRFGRLVSGTFLATGRAKQELAAATPGALAADMESSAFREGVGPVPWLILRAISDDLHSDLPLPFDELLTPAGFPDERAILAQVARKPRLLPEVIALAKGSAAAMQAMTQTVRDIRPIIIRRLMDLH